MSGGFSRSAAATLQMYKAVESALGTADFSSRLMHYTTLDNLELMVANRTLWFGQLSEMNDPSEFDHYIDGILDAIYSLEVIGDLAEIEAEIRNRAHDIKVGTYSSSWCEYYESERSGLLDMWRTYGGNGTGVGIVVDSAPFLPSNLTAEILGFPVNASKVKYVPRSNIRHEVNDMFRRLSNVPGIALNPWKTELIVPLLLAKAPCVKHHSYQTEREVRFLFYHSFRHVFPGAFPAAQQFLSFAEVGEPRRKYLVLPLQEYPEFGIDLRPEAVVSRIVIGSNTDSAKVQRGVNELLNDYGVGGIEVVVSDIPMR